MNSSTSIVSPSVADFVAERQRREQLEQEVVGYRQTLHDLVRQVAELEAERGGTGQQQQHTPVDAQLDMDGGVSTSATHMPTTEPGN